MIELGELDRRREEFTSRGLRVFAISVDGVGDTRNLQEKFQSLRMVSDEEGSYILNKSTGETHWLKEGAPGKF